MRAVTCRIACRLSTPRRQDFGEGAKNAGATLSSFTGGSIEGNIDVRDGALATLQTSVNTLASQLITQVNTVYSAGVDLNGNSGQNFFTGADASDIGVNSTVVNDPSTFQASGTAGAAGDNSVALALAQLANQPVAALNNQTFTQNYAQTVGALGSALSSVNDQVNNSTAVSQMLSNQRASVSGVSTDDEMTNLVQFQKAYQASAELITTVNQMLETLVSNENRVENTKLTYAHLHHNVYQQFSEQRQPVAAAAKHAANRGQHRPQGHAARG